MYNRMPMKMMYTISLYILYTGMDGVVYGKLYSLAHDFKFKLGENYYGDRTTFSAVCFHCTYKNVP